MTITGCPSSASCAARWLNGMLASRGIRPQMLSCSAADGNNGVVWPQPGQTWPLMFSTPEMSVTSDRPRWTAWPLRPRCPISLRASWCAMTCGVTTTSTHNGRP